MMQIPRAVIEDSDFEDDEIVLKKYSSDPV